MVTVFFVYGLAFFVLGLVIIVYPKKGSIFKLADNLWLIAGFGILHGINEWLDMFILISEPTPPMPLKIIRAIILPCSFLFLLWFGTKVIVNGRKKYSFIMAVPLVLFAVWAVIAVLSKNRLVTGDIMARYLLGLPGAFLTALGLLQQIPQFKQTKLRGVVRSIRLAAIVFLFYSVLAGLVVKKADFFPANLLNYEMFQNVFGFPVQILRAVCAVVAAFSTIYCLKVFRWETREAIRRNEQRYSMVAMSCPIILYGQDRDSVITFAMGKGLDVLGLKSGDIIGRHISEVFPSAPVLLEDSRRAIRGEEFASTVTINDVTLEFYYSPLRDSDGEITGVIGVAIDVTAKVHAQGELDKYRHDMEKNARLVEIGTMGSIMAQKIDEPLMVARMLLQRILSDTKSGSGPDALADDLKKGLSEVSKVGDIVERFRGMAQVARKTAIEPIDIYEITKRMIRVFAQSARRVNLKIAVRNIDIAPYIMSITAHELEQVFFILFRHVIDTADSSRKQKLVISCRVDDKQMELQFEDTCGGVGAEALQHIFKPFSVTEPYAKQANLGLAVAKQIICARGGDIKVESQFGKGTRFYVTLPIAQAS